MFVGYSSVLRKTKKQHRVSHSSAEVEYRSMATITTKVKWLRALLLDLGVCHSQPIPPYY